MIEPRIYRAALIPAVLAVLLVMFSLENRPRAAPQGLAADALFEGRVALADLRQIVERWPDRRPGSVSGAAMAHELTERFRALERSGFETAVDSWEEQGEPLVNVIARRPGATREQIVIMAARDAESVPDATGSAGDTAALLELARAIRGRPAQKTLVLVSVDGSTLGDAGARRFAETAEDGDRIETVIVLSNLAAGESRGPAVLAWSNDDRRGNLGVMRTALASVREEFGAAPSEEGAIGQFVRLAYPVGVGAQGGLLARGIDALRFSGSGELPPPEDERGLEDVSVDRLGQLGRSSLRLVSALDAAAAPPAHGPESYITIRGQVLPGWVLRVLAAALLLPALVASIDAFARARRRRAGVPGWWRSVIFRTLPFVAVYIAAELLVLVGQAPNPGSAPPAPDAYPLDGAAAATLGVSLAAGILAWLLVRPSLKRHAPEAARGGPGAVTAVALCAVATLVWLVNPFTALLLVPAVHLWMLAMLAGGHLRRGTAIAAVAVGLAPPLAAGAVYLDRLGLNPVEALWYLWLLVGGHAIGPLSTLLLCTLAGVAASAFAVMAARVGAAPPAEPEAPSVRGPAGYAGPGSLGGTESALSRR